jgi:hypothetical protein
MEQFEPTIVAFCCHYCAYTAADMAGSMRLDLSPKRKDHKGAVQWQGGCHPHHEGPGKRGGRCAGGRMPGRRLSL